MFAGDNATTVARAPSRIEAAAVFVSSDLNRTASLPSTDSGQVHRFAHAEAMRVSQTALAAARRARLIVIDMSRVDEATTSAFARLVLLRRELLRLGRDLRIAGLRDRAARLFEISRLDSVLPRL